MWGYFGFLCMGSEADAISLLGACVVLDGQPIKIEGEYTPPVSQRKRGMEDRFAPISPRRRRDSCSTSPRRPLLPPSQVDYSRRWSPSPFRGGDNSSGLSHWDHRRSPSPPRHSSPHRTERSAEPRLLPKSHDIASREQQSLDEWSEMPARERQPANHNGIREGPNWRRCVLPSAMCVEVLILCAEHYALASPRNSATAGVIVRPPVERMELLLTLYDSPQQETADTRTAVSCRIKALLAFAE